MKTQTTTTPSWNLLQWLLVFLYFSTVFSQQSKTPDDSTALCENPEPFDLPPEDYVSVYAPENNQAFQAIEQCIEEGTLDHCQKELKALHLHSIKDTRKAAFDFFYFHPNDIEQLLQTVMSLMLRLDMPALEPIRNHYTQDHRYSLRYQFEIRLLEQLTTKNTEEVKRLLEFRQFAGDQLSEEDGSMKVWFYYETKYWNANIFLHFAVWEHFPDITLSTSAQQGLARHIAQGDSDGAAWLVRHLMKRNSAYAKAMGLALQQCSPHFQIKPFVLQLFAATGQAIAAASDADFEKVINPLLVLHAIAPDSERVKFQIDALIYQALDNHNEKQIDHLMTVGLTEAFPFDERHFFEKIEAFAKKPELPTLLRKIFHDRDEWLKNAETVYAKKRAQHLDPYFEIRQILAEENTITTRLIYQCFIPNQRTEKNNPEHWLTYLIEAPDALPRLTALWMSASEVKWHGEPSRTDWERLIQVIHEAYYEGLRKANEQHDIAELNRLLPLFSRLNEHLKYSSERHFADHLDRLKSRGITIDPDWQGDLVNMPLTELSDDAFVALAHLAKLNIVATLSFSEALSKLTPDEFAAKIKVITPKALADFYVEHLGQYLNKIMTDSLQSNDVTQQLNALGHIQHPAYHECMRHVDWTLIYILIDVTKSIEHLERLILHPFSARPNDGMLEFLLLNKRFTTLETVNTMHPEWIDEVFASKTIADVSMPLAEAIVRSNPHVRKEVMAQDALSIGTVSFTKMAYAFSKTAYAFAKTAIELMPTTNGDNDIANHLQYECAKRNLVEHQALLLKKGVKPDVNNGSVTPLDIAITGGHFEFASLIIDAYLEQNLPITTIFKTNFLFFFNKAIEKLLAGELHSATRLGFFQVTHNKKLLKIAAGTTTVITAIVAAFLLQKIVSHCRSPKKRGFLRECRQTLKLIVLSDNFNNYLDNNSNQIAPHVVCPITRQPLYPISMVMSDGKTYGVNDYTINTIFSKKEKSPTSNIKLIFENLRINVNLISYLHIRTKTHLKKEIKKLKEKIALYSKLSNNLSAQEAVNEAKQTLKILRGYQKELAELQYPFPLFENIDACLRDPNTKAIMEHPCIAPDGKSYDVPLPEGKPTRFKADIEGLGENIVVYRNIELQDLCDKYRAHMNESAPMLTNKRPG